MGSVVGAIWLSKVPDIIQNQIQHMKLRHFSYITPLKLQHILFDTPEQPPIYMIYAYSQTSLRNLTRKSYTVKLEAS